MKKGILVVVSAPAGCGKDTILEKALARNSDLFYSVSATSRDKRPGETEGQSYYFKTRDEFKAMIAAGELLEHTKYCGNYYGTPKRAVADMLEAGKDVILKIEIEGAANVKKIFPECVMIFILPPSLGELERRLRSRGTEDGETILKRIAVAEKELAFAQNYDYIILNDDLETAVKDFLDTIRVEKFRTSRCGELLEEIAR